MKKQFLFVFLLLCTKAFTQNMQWAKRTGGTGADEGYSIGIDTAGNTYTVGSFSGVVDFDPNTGTANLTSAGNDDIFILKLNASGKLVWAKRIGGTAIDKAYSVAIDVAGNIYVTGSFQGMVDFDPGAGTTNLISAGSDDVFVLKLNTSGNFVWARRMGGSGSDMGYGIVADKNGNVHTTGSFSGRTDFDPGVGTDSLISAGAEDIFISKLDASGNAVWAKRIGNSGRDQSRAIALDIEGNVYTTGYFYYTVDFDPGTGTFNLIYSGNSDGFISKLDSFGGFVWAGKYGSSNFDNGSAIAVDASKNIYVGGYFENTPDFDPGSGVYNLTSAGSGDIVILKLDASCNFKWAKRMGDSGPDEAMDIAVDASGNVYTTGLFKGTVDFDPGSSAFNLKASGDLDIFVLKLDANGNFSSVSQLGGKNDDIVRSMIVTNDGYIYTAGYFVGAADMDPSSSIYYLGYAGVTDIFISKLGPCPSPAGNVAGPVSVCYGDTTTYYIQPAAGVSSYTWTVPSGITLKSGQGTTAIKVSIGNTSGTADITIFTGGFCGNTEPVILPVTINPTPKVGFTVTPSTTICEGYYLTLSGKGAVTYKWTGGILILNANPFTLYASDTFVVTGTDAKGCKDTDTARIKVIPSPSIYISPKNQTVAADATVVFTMASSTPDDSYQWQVKVGTAFVNLTNSGKYSGVNNDTMTITKVIPSFNNNVYRCMATLGSCSANTYEAVLKVTGVSAVPEIGKDEFSFSVYPNPSGNIITIQVNNEFSEGVFVIKDPAGRQVLSGNLTGSSTGVNMDGLSAGLYFVQVGGYCKTIVKQ